MTETPTKTGAPQKGNQKRSSIWMILAVLLLIIVAGLLIFLMPKINEYQELAKEKDQQKTLLQYELNDLLMAHDSIKREYGTLADSLRVKDSIIQANAEEIKQLLNYKWEYNKVNKKLSLLRNITQGYVHQLDSLYTVNRDLKEENEKIRQQYALEQDRSRELSRDKEELIEKVNNAAILGAYNLKVKTVRFTGSGRERDTDKASKVERVKICFTLGANPLVEPGMKTIYTRIIRPDGVVVTQKVGEDYSFEFNGKTMEYTIKKEVKYEQEDMDLCLSWDKKSKEESAMLGIYNVFVYYDQFEIGKSSFELK
ncbi:MAG TPA: hypothetical protein P5514_15235 [Bacteroidales bacterium]|nr:hypothetical protein [Bacteroidales bacterium]HRX98301.1 hypothetical protein [Bacteroidales bacterium]